MQKDSGAGKKKGMLYEEIILSGNSYARQNKTSNYLFCCITCDNRKCYTDMPLRKVPDRSSPVAYRLGASATTPA